MIARPWCCDASGCCEGVNELPSSSAGVGEAATLRENSELPLCFVADSSAASAATSSFGSMNSLSLNRSTMLDFPPSGESRGAASAIGGKRRKNFTKSWGRRSRANRLRTRMFRKFETP